MMRIPSLRTIAPVAAAAAVLASTPAAAQAVRYELVPAQTRVWFDADATMGHFQGTAGQVSGWADVPAGTGAGGARGEVNVGAASFRTGIALRNQHLRTELQADRYPFIRFVLERTEAGAGSAVTLHGRLVVKDHSTPVAISATAARTDGGLTVDGSLPTKFTALGMRPPTRMGGLTRVRDDLTLHFHAVFRRAGG